MIFLLCICNCHCRWWHTLGGVKLIFFFRYIHKWLIFYCKVKECSSHRISEFFLQSTRRCGHDVACHASLGLCFLVFESTRLTPRKVFLLFLYSYALVPHFSLERFLQILLDTFSASFQAGVWKSGTILPQIRNKYCEELFVTQILRYLKRNIQNLF